MLTLVRHKVENTVILVCATCEYNSPKFGVTNKFWDYISCEVRTMNGKLIIALLCGNQCHCQKVGHRKWEKWSSQSMCHEWGQRC